MKKIDLGKNLCDGIRISFWTSPRVSAQNSIKNRLLENLQINLLSSLWNNPRTSLEDSFELSLWESTKVDSKDESDSTNTL